MKRLVIPTLALILSVLACSMPGQTPEPPILTEPPVITEPPATEAPVLIEPPLPATNTPSGFMVNAGSSEILFYSPEAH